MAWTFYSASGEAMILDGGLANVVEDTTPQLGGNLDMQANLLVGNGGSTGIAISSAGEVTMAAQPMVLAKAPSSSNVTGAATAYTMTWTTEVFDQNADFDGTSTFTAPITGRYLVHASVFFSGMTLAQVTGLRITIVASNRSIIGDSPLATANTGTAMTETTIAATTLVDMDASDTVTITAYVSGMSGDTADVNTNSFLSIALIG